MPTLVQFGAGNIGRSFIAQLFNAAGYKVIFIDVNPDLLKLLNERGCYKVNIVGDRDEVFIVSNISAIDGRDIAAVAAAIADADIASTAVGSGALPYIMPHLPPDCKRDSRRIKAHLISYWRKTFVVPQESWTII